VHTAPAESLGPGRRVLYVWDARVADRRCRWVEPLVAFLAGTEPARPIIGDRAPTEASIVLRPNLTGQRLTALAVLGWLLFTHPLLSLFSRPASVLQIPVLYLYLFVTWALLIVLMALVATRSDRDREAHPWRDAR
jgi:hypothetical protein